MAYFKDIYWYFLCILSYTLKGIESAKIFTIDLPNAVDDVATFKINDDYNPITEYAFDDRNKRQIIYKTQNPQKMDLDEAATNEVICHRLFGSMFGSKNQHIKCMQALKTNTRSHDYVFYEPFKKRKRNSTVHNQFVRQDGYRSLIDLTKFARDYIDVKDLGRSDGFASDYVDIEDFKSSPALPNCNELDINAFDDHTKVDCVPSRKSAIGRNNKNFFRRLTTIDEDTDSSSSESVEESKVKQSKPNLKKRYKVISNENSGSSSSDNTNESDENDHTKDEDVPSEDGSPITRDKSDETESDSTKESSVEVTTKKYKKPKVKSKKLGKIEDRYVYLQGNKIYNTDDFRRGMRLPHFLPKKYHWDPDDYHKLGYYWFNGPKGEYRN